MKNISRWGKRNPWKTRLIIVFVQLVLAAYAALLGVWLYAGGWNLPGYLLSLGVILFMIATFFYPYRKARFWFFRHTYRRQKTMDLLLIVASFLMVTTFSHQYTHSILSEAPAYRAEFMVNKTPSRSLKSERRGLREHLKVQRQTLKAEVKALVKDMKAQQSDAGKVSLIFLTIIVALVLLYGLVALSCSIACSGADGLAILVFVAGLGLIVWGSVVVIKRILRREAPAGVENGTS